MRVHEVGADAVGRHGEVDAERLQRRVRGRELGEVGVRGRAGLVARRAEAAHLDVDVAALPQRADQLGDVHTRSSVDRGRVLLAEDVDAHVRDITQ